METLPRECPVCGVHWKGTSFKSSVIRREREAVSRRDAAFAQWAQQWNAQHGIDDVPKK